MIRPPPRSTPFPYPTLFRSVGVLLGLWAGANAANVFSISAIIPASLLYVAVAVVFWQESRRQETLADRVLGGSVASWGVLWVALPVFNSTPQLGSPGMNMGAPAPTAFLDFVFGMDLSL